MALRRLVSAALGGFRPFTAPVLFTAQFAVGTVPLALVVVASQIGNSGLAVPFVLGAALAIVILFLHLVLPRVLSKHATQAADWGEEGDGRALSISDAISFVLLAKGPAAAGLHALVGAALLGTAAAYLTPSAATTMLPSAPMLLLALWWMSVGVALAFLFFARTSVDMGPNVSHYDTSDNLGLARASPALYALVCVLAVGMELMGLAGVAAIFLAGLWLLWPTGSLPPVHVLMDWAVEQCLIFGFGGTGTVSMAHGVASLAAAAGATAIVAGAASTGWGAPVGLVLGHCLALPLLQLRECPALALRASAWAGLSAALAMALASSPVAVLAADAGLVAICALRAAAAIAQRPPFATFTAPATALGGLEETVQETWAAHAHGVLAVAASVVATAAITVHIASEDLSTGVAAMLGLRALRWPWQSPADGALEAAVVLSLRRAGALGASGLSLQLAIAALAHNRLRRFLGNLQLQLGLLSGIALEPKQRFDGDVVVIGLVVLFWPIALCANLVASTLAAPLLPVFSTPICAVTFPRASRFWWPDPKAGPRDHTAPVPDRSPPELEDAVADGAFYAHLVESLAKSALPRLVRSGQLPFPTPGGAGSIVLVRLSESEAVVVVQVVSASYCHVTASFRGLERRATSCHFVEGAALDEAMDAAIPTPGGSRGSDVERSVSGMLRFALRCYRPLCRAPVEAYAIASSSLSGVLDHPDRIAVALEGVSFALVHALRTTHRRAPKDVALPTEWNTVLAEAKASSLPGTAVSFPHAWDQFLCAKMGGVGGKGPGGSQALIYIFQHLLAVALGPAPGLASLMASFEGRMPPTLELRALQRQCPALVTLLQRAVQRGLKAGYDAVTLMNEARFRDASEYDDIFSDLQSLGNEQEWFVGAYGSDGWRRAVASRSPSFFALRRGDAAGQLGLPQGHGTARNRGTFAGGGPRAVHMHLRRESAAFMAWSPQAVHGLWASLLAELLFAANEDDERFSVQASTLLLRNMAVSSSAPPLGYPVYLSGPVHGFTLPPLIRARLRAPRRVIEGSKSTTPPTPEQPKSPLRHFRSRTLPPAALVHPEGEPVHRCASEYPRGMEARTHPSVEAPASPASLASLGGPPAGRCVDRGSRTSADVGGRSGGTVTLGPVRAPKGAMHRMSRAASQPTANSRAAGAHSHLTEQDLDDILDELQHPSCAD